MVGSLSFNVQGGGGGGSRPIRTHLDRQKKGERESKNWTFFLDVINVWSHTVSSDSNNLMKLVLKNCLTSIEDCE